MKTRLLLFYLIIEMVCVGCQGKQPSIATTLSPQTAATPQVLLTAISPILTNTKTPLPTDTTSPEETATLEPIALSTLTMSQNGIQVQCVNVGSSRSDKISSDGKVILNDQNHSKIVLLDMTNGNTSTLDGIDASISPDGKFMAYYRIDIDAQNNITERELIVSDANGQPIKAIRWEKSWDRLIGWATSEHLVIRLLGVGEYDAGTPSLVLALNPFTGKQALISPNFSEMLYTPSTVLPYWDGWAGVVYDPSLSFAVYPRFVDGNKEKFTYGLWDVTANELVVSLDNVFSSYAAFNDIFPRPWWSPDGSKFIFSNYVVSPNRVDTELYSVNRKGQIEKLTNLAPNAYLFDSFGWSPNQQYIATYIYTSDLQDKDAAIAIFNPTSHDVTNYCLTVTYGGDEYGLAQPSVPIWSPDSTQFLVMDWHEKKHSRVILVDIVGGFAVQIAEDMEPLGWMLAP